MATNTTNYSFKKPDESEFYNIQDQNGNWDKADAALKELDNPAFEDYTGSTPVPDAATALGNMKSKSKLSTMFSNVKAFCKGAVTLGMIVNNCVTNRSDLPGSAAQLKVLMDLHTKLNSDLTAKLATKANTADFTLEKNVENITFGTADGKRYIMFKHPDGTMSSLEIIDSGLQLSRFHDNVWDIMWTIPASK